MILISRFLRSGLVLFACLFLVGCRGGSSGLTGRGLDSQSTRTVDLNTPIPQPAPPTHPVPSTPAQAESPQRSATPPPTRITIIGEWPGKAVTDYAWSPDSSMLAVTSLGVDSDFVELIEAKSGEILWTLETESGPFHVEFSPSGNELAVGFHTYPVRILDVASGDVLMEFADSLDCIGAGVSWITFSSDSKSIYTARSGGRGADLRTYLFRLSTANQYCAGSIKFIRGHLNFMSLAGSDQLIITSLIEHTYEREPQILVWDASSTELVCNFHGVAFELSSHGTFLVTQSEEGVYLLVNPERCEELARLEMVGGRFVSINQEADSLATYSSPTISVWSLPEGRRVESFVPPALDLSYGLSPDWRYLVGEKSGVSSFFGLYQLNH